MSKRKMKKRDICVTGRRCLLAGLSVAMLCSACGSINPHAQDHFSLGAEAGKPEEEIEQTETEYPIDFRMERETEKPGPEGDAAQTEAESTSVETEKVETDINIKPAAMVDGRLYVDTGYNSSLLRCGNFDGNFTEVIPDAEQPSEDGQINVKGADGYQWGVNEHTIEVQWNGKFRIFAEPGTYEDEVPYGVAWLRGTVTEIGEDDRITIRAEIDEKEDWPFYGAFTDGALYRFTMPDSGEAVKEGDLVLLHCDPDREEMKPAILTNVYDLSVLDPRKEAKSSFHKGKDMLS